MADPLTWAIIGTTAAIASAGMSAVGAMNSAKAKKNAAVFNAQVAERDATVSRQQAASDADASHRESVRRIGLMRASYGASGVTPEGSPLDVLASSAAEAKLDELNIRYRGELKAVGYTDTAKLDRASGDVAMSQGMTNATSALLGGVGSAASMGVQYKALKATK